MLSNGKKQTYGNIKADNFEQKLLYVLIKKDSPKIDSPCMMACQIDGVVKKQDRDWMYLSTM